MEESTIRVGDKLEAARRARLEKSLSQLFRYSDGVYTRGEWMERHAVSVASREVPSVEFNSNKFNRMNYAEQEAYEKKLEKRKTIYVANKSDGTFHEIPKIVFDHYVDRI